MREQLLQSDQNISPDAREAETGGHRPGVGSPARKGKHRRRPRHRVSSARGQNQHPSGSDPAGSTNSFSGEAWRGDGAPPAGSETLGRGGAGARVRGGGARVRRWGTRERGRGAGRRRDRSGRRRQQGSLTAMEEESAQQQTTPVRPWIYSRDDL